MSEGAKRGVVSLVGAGPGDPGLITIAGVARLAEADVVVYDRLANPVLLAHARAGAELIYVGKTPDRHTLSQEEINALLVEKARAGLRVVRLKGGDPFVFGRGGEEAQALVAAGVPLEVVPGVTSAVAAPAYAGIPITHRGLASSFAVVTGHEDPSKPDSSIDWARLATGVDTLVFLMGAERLDEIAARLIEHGRDPRTPAAVIEWGTMPRQRVAAGRLSTIAAEVSAQGITSPAVTVVGDVAALRGDLRWFDNRPLSGVRVLVTRTREQASELSRALAAQGAEPVELPTIDIQATFDPREVVAMLRELGTAAFDWVIFTSANAVSIFMAQAATSGFDARIFGRARIAAIGPGTAQALARHGLRADLVPARYVAEALLEDLTPRVIRGERVLLPRAEGARDVLVNGLERAGAVVREVCLYRAVTPPEPRLEGLRRLRAGDIDVVAVASSSSVRGLVDLLRSTARDDAGDALAPLRRCSIVAIGPVTAAEVREQGLEVAAEAEEHTIEGLVRAVAECAAVSAR